MWIAENWKDYKNHAFFESPSIRKIGDTYYFVFSSQVMHELCYATSKNPTSGFRYQGVIVSNTDIGIDSYKPADMPAAYGANNHGGFVKILDDYYIFYHRHVRKQVEGRLWRGPGASGGGRHRGRKG